MMPLARKNWLSKVWRRDWGAVKPSNKALMSASPLYHRTSTAASTAAMAPMAASVSFLDPVRGAAKFVEGSVEISDHVINIWLGPV